jgi:hypothetical protein
MTTPRFLLLYSFQASKTARPPAGHAELLFGKMQAIEIMLVADGI